MFALFRWPILLNRLTDPMLMSSSARRTGYFRSLAEAESFLQEACVFTEPVKLGTPYITIDECFWYFVVDCTHVPLEEKFLDGQLEE